MGTGIKPSEFHSRNSKNSPLVFNTVSGGMDDDSTE